MMKEASITPQPIYPDAVFDSWFLNNPFTIKPISGNNGTR
jgi:hypothetical protein